MSGNEFEQFLEKMYGGVGGRLVPTPFSDIWGDCIYFCVTEGVDRPTKTWLGRRLGQHFEREKRSGEIWYK